MSDSTTKRIGTADLTAILRREILRGDLHPGDRLPSERELAQTHMVARGTLRSALNNLEAEQLVEIRAGSGTYVTHRNLGATGSPIDAASPMELMDARFALEPHVCRLAVMHGRRGDFELLDDLCTQMEDNRGDPHKFSEADTEFHHHLVGSTRNGLLIWIVGQINSVRSQNEWTRMRQLTLDPNIITQYNVQHRQILNAIRTREPERAASLMKDHLETARLSLTRAAAT